MRMLEAGRDPDLAEEAVGADAGVQLGAEHIDGDGAVVLAVLGQEHGGHAAATEFAVDGIGLRQGVAQALDR